MMIARMIPLFWLLAGCGDDPRICPNDLPDASVCPGPSYANDVAPLIMLRCSPCHFPGGIEDSVHDFSTYPHVFMQRSQILNMVHACAMPPADQPQLDMMQRFVLQSWLVCGAQNN